MGTKPKTVTATEFRAKCLELLAHREPTGLVITKRGRPIARVMPFVNNSNLIGSLKCEVEVLGDIFSTGEKWEAES
jgi:prevent-host-death family protein